MLLIFFVPLPFSYDVTFWVVGLDVKPWNAFKVGSSDVIMLPLNSFFFSVVKIVESKF